MSVPGEDDDEMRPYYDFSKGIKNPYAARFREGSNVVLLDPDVAREFRDSDAVNEVLLGLLRSGRERRDKQAS